MSFRGIHLTLMIGQTVPVPAPTAFIEAFKSAEVCHADKGRSGFQLTFNAGRSRTDRLDYALLSSPLLKPMNRVVILVKFNTVPQVLMDGIIADQQFAPGNQPGESIFTVTGEDISVMMDIEEKSVEHPGQPEAAIATKIIGSYAQYGLIPEVIPPSSVDTPLATERIPVQQGTDMDYLQELASRCGYVFYIIPGPAPLTNTAYWGPPIRTGVPQKALSINMGPNTNATLNNTRYNSLATTYMAGQIQDRITNEVFPVKTSDSTRLPLVSQPAWKTQYKVRTCQFRQSGLTTTQAMARAQAETDASTDQTIAVEGELDAARYEALLQPRSLVGLRGAGYSYDGLYYVKSVLHSISKGEYTQKFKLTRE